MPEKLVIPPACEPITLAEAKLHLRVTDDDQDVIISGLISAARFACETKTRQQLMHARWKQVFDRFPMAGIGTPLPFAQDVQIPGFAAILPHAPFVDMASITYLDMSGVSQTVDPAIYTVNDAAMPAHVSPTFGNIWPIPLPQVGAVQFTYDAGYASPIVFATPRTFTVNGPVTWAVGDTIQFSNSGGALPAGLTAKAPYKVATVAGSVYTFTNFDGTPVTLSDTGTGQCFIGVVPDGLRNWILIRVGSMYENREEVAILNRGKVEELPFIDGLLDPYRISLP
jgi:uncharacterized phiE125 gp8 family phage protein